MIQRRVLLAAATAAFAALAAPSVVAAETWDMPDAYSAQNFITQAYGRFAEDVKQRTGGALDIVVHPAGSLYNGADILRAVRSGQVPIGARFIGAHSAEDPIFGLDSLPFLATSGEEAWALYEASREALAAALAERNMHLLFVAVWPPQGLFVNKPVESVADMRGVKFRAYDANTTRLAELMGAVPTKTEATEIAQAFSTGIAESMMASGAIGVFQKMWDYVDYYYLVNAWLPKSVVVVNLDAWNDLDEATRAALTEAGEAAEKEILAEMETQAAGYNKTMADSGMQVLEPSEALASGLRDIGATMASEWAAGAGERGRAVLQAYEAAR